VYKGNDDNVVGVLNTLDLFDLWLTNEKTAPAASGTTGGAKEFRVSSYLRQVQFVPDSMPAGKILEDMRAKSYQVAIVLDEFGGTDGVITLKDLVEQLVGEIWDEHDAPNPGVTKLDDRRWHVKGELTLLEVRNELGASLDSWSTITIAGAVTEKIGRQPQVGDSIESDGYRYTVAEMKNRVISLVEVVKLDQPASPDADGGSETTTT